MVGSDATPQELDSPHWGIPPRILSVCCAAAMVAETVTYPLDMLKTRIQVFGELKKTSHPGVIKLSVSIIRTEGILQLWQGLSPALLRHLVYTGSRVPIYELIRREVFHLPPATHFTITANNQHQHGVPEAQSAKLSSQSAAFVTRAALAGAVAGGLAQFFASPTDLVKVRLQTERRWKSEVPFSPKPSHYPSSNLAPPRSSFFGCLRQLLNEGGLLGLWRGGLPNVQRAALVNMGELTTYDAAKRWLAVKFQLVDGPVLHISASAMSGFVAAVLGTPADMVKTRIMNQRGFTQSGGNQLYNGMMDCMKKIWKTEGFLSMYKGFFLIWARMAPWSLTFWLTYEKIRVLTGIGGF